MNNNSDNQNLPRTKIGVVVVIALLIVGITLIFLAIFTSDNEKNHKYYELKTTSAKTITTIISENTPNSMFPKDANEVTFEELITIDGIGEDVAKKIIDYRNSCGGFDTLLQLLNVDGIGDKRYNILCNYLYVEGDSGTSQTTSVTVSAISLETTHRTTTVKTSTRKPSTTIPKPKSTTVASRKIVNINKASLNEIMEGLLLTHEEAESIIRLRNDIQYFQNPLEVLYATDVNGKPMFSDSEYNKFKDYITVK